MHAQCQTLAAGIVGALGNGQQLDHISQLVGEFNVLILNVIDAFNVNVDFADARVKRQTCQDRQFLCRVAPAYIQRGISLGKPSFCASASDWVYDQPIAVICVRMKLQVPFTMPSSASIRLAINPFIRALMMGIPPAQLASNATQVLCFLARAKSSGPCSPAAAYSPLREVLKLPGLRAPG